MNDTHDSTAPKALASTLLEEDRRHIWHPFTQHATEGPPLLLTGARNASTPTAPSAAISQPSREWTK